MPLHPWSEPGFWTLLSLFSSPLLSLQKQKSGASLNVAEVHRSNLYGKICRCSTDRTDTIYSCVPEHMECWLLMPNPPLEILKNKEFSAGFSAFAFMKILMYFVIFVSCIENIHRNMLLLSKASLALLRIDVPASLCFLLYQSSSLTAHLLYFRFIRRFRPTLCDLASQCMSSDAMLNALATDAVNLLWHRVRPFCVAE